MIADKKLARLQLRYGSTAAIRVVIIIVLTRESQ